MIGTTNAYATSLGLFFDTSFHFFPQKMLLGQACFVKGGLFTVKGIFVYIFVSLFWHLFHLTTGNFEALYLKNG